MAACKALALETVNAGVVNPEATPADCAQIAIAANSFQRDLNLVEMSRALNLLASFLTDPAQVEDAAGALNLPQSSARINKIQKIERLPAALKDSLLQNRISLEMALELDGLGSEAGAAVCRLFSRLQLSRGKQRELLTNLMEISRRDDIPVGRLLASRRVQNVLSDREMDRNQKTKRLRDLFREKRFPRLYASEKRFAGSLKKISTGNRMSLHPPDYFEGDAFTVHFSFRDPKELTHHLKTLEQLAQNPLLSDLMSKK
jgi:hypothetical protein